MPQTKEEKAKAARQAFLSAKSALFPDRTTSCQEIPFDQFVQRYCNDLKPRLKESTWDTKECLIQEKILPFFADTPVGSLTPRDVIVWQNLLMNMRQPNGNPYSKTYLKTCHNQLSAILNHGVRYYELGRNVARIAGSIGKARAIRTQIWTVEEYKRFSDAITDKPLSYYAFELLFWCGIREGELLALTQNDFNLSRKELCISKTYHRSHGRDVITDPKTEQSNRTIRLPQFLCREIADFFSLYCTDDGDARLFPFTKHYLTHEMERGAAAAGVQKLRIHDLRHSHVSILIAQGYSAIDIARRLGHENIEVTLAYAHMFPSVQDQMAERLDYLKEE